jgi:uncharacterized membrane protein YoaK (UPF0700 family)
MTGNTVLLSIALVQEDTQAILNSGVALFGFVAGAALGAWIVHSEEPTGVWPGRVTVALALETTVLIAFALVWWRAGDQAYSHPVLGLALIAVAASAMGMQSAAARRLAVSGVSTVAVTGTLTGLTADLVAVVRRGTASSAPGYGLGLLVVWLSYAGGAAIAVASPRERLAALVFPAALTVLVVVTSVIASRQRWRPKDDGSSAA